MLFGYFDSTVPGFKAIPDEPDSVGIEEGKYRLPYALLEKARMAYSITEPTHPLGAWYKEHLSGDKGKGAGFRAKTLFLGEHSC